MCLHVKFGKIKAKKIIKTAIIGNEYIRLYKAVKITRNTFRNICQFFHKYIFTGGINIAQQNMISSGTFKYLSGFHCCATKTGAREWVSRSPENIIEVLVKPSWITTVGSQFHKKTFVCSKMVVPEYPAKKVIIREFRRICKEHDNDNQKTKS